MDDNILWREKVRKSMSKKEQKNREHKLTYSANDVTCNAMVHCIVKEPCDKITEHTTGMWEQHNTQKYKWNSKKMVRVKFKTIVLHTQILSI